MSNKKAKIYQSVKEKNQEKLECNYDTEKSHPQNQSDSQNLKPGLFQPQNDFEKALSTFHHEKKAKSKIEEPLIQPTSTKHSKEKPNSNFILVDNNPSTSKVMQTSNEEPSTSQKKKKLPQYGLFDPIHSDHFEEKISHYQPLSVSSWKKFQVNVEAPVREQFQENPQRPFSTKLPKGIHFQSIGSLSITKWLVDLDKSDPSNDPEACNVPIFTLDSTILTPNIPKSHQPLFQLAQSLFVPNLQKKQFWANLILESISVSSQDLIQPEKLEITESTEADPLIVKQLSLELLVSCLITRPSHSAQI
ncbi:hypothetical protein O181_096072 [Austropuccinia psidii MF-1]|uniref:Uncharacterized protein n=1 Tax=Austropuccinia psidii MF-1 TaxID=1389203 RepID=A0A9Q3PD56_9BASI|nr:hypothetical protein [Austropuccinia psidii MF-1]